MAIQDIPLFVDNEIPHIKLFFKNVGETDVYLKQTLGSNRGSVTIVWSDGQSYTSPADNGQGWITSSRTGLQLGDHEVILYGDIHTLGDAYQDWVDAQAPNRPSNWEGINSVEFNNIQSLRNISYAFQDDPYLETVKFRGITQLESCYKAFHGCTNLKSVEFDVNCDLSGVQYMNEMFNGCTSLTTLDMSNLNVPCLQSPPTSFATGAPFYDISANKPDWQGSCDTTPPSVPVITRSGDRWIGAYTNNLSFNFTWVSDNTAIKYELEVRNDISTFFTKETSQLSYLNSELLADDGTYYFYVRAIDDAGNKSEWGNIQFILDRESPAPPVVTVTSPSDATIPVWNWTISDDTTHFRYRLDHGPLSDEIDATDADKQFSPASPLSHGGHIFEVQARDAAGNLSQYGSASVFVNRIINSIPLFNVSEVNFDNQVVTEIKLNGESIWINPIPQPTPTPTAIQLPWPNFRFDDDIPTIIFLKNATNYRYHNFHLPNVLYFDGWTDNGYPTYANIPRSNGVSEDIQVYVQYDVDYGWTIYYSLFDWQNFVWTDWEYTPHYSFSSSSDITTVTDWTQNVNISDWSKIEFSCDEQDISTYITSFSLYNVLRGPSNEIVFSDHLKFNIEFNDVNFATNTEIEVNEDDFVYVNNLQFAYPNCTENQSKYPTVISNGFHNGGLTVDNSGSQPQITIPLEFSTSSYCTGIYNDTFPGQLMVFKSVRQDYITTVYGDQWREKKAIFTVTNKVGSEWNLTADVGVVNSTFIAIKWDAVTDAESYEVRISSTNSQGSSNENSQTTQIGTNTEHTFDDLFSQGFFNIVVISKIVINNPLDGYTWTRKIESDPVHVELILCLTTEPNHYDRLFGVTGADITLGYPSVVKPTLFVGIGCTYVFRNSKVGGTLSIIISSDGTVGGKVGEYGDGDSTYPGTITWTPTDTGTYYYMSENDSLVGGIINVVSECNC